MRLFESTQNSSEEQRIAMLSFNLQNNPFFRGAIRELQEIFYPQDKNFDIEEFNKLMGLTKPYTGAE